MNTLTRFIVALSHVIHELIKVRIGVVFEFNLSVKVQRALGKELVLNECDQVAFKVVQTANRLVHRNRLPKAFPAQAFIAAGKFLFIERDRPGRKVDQDVMGPIAQFRFGQCSHLWKPLIPPNVTQCARSDSLPIGFYGMNYLLCKHRTQYGCGSRRTPSVLRRTDCNCVAPFSGVVRCLTRGY